MEFDQFLKKKFKFQFLPAAFSSTQKNSTFYRSKMHVQTQLQLPKTIFSKSFIQISTKSRPNASLEFVVRQLNLLAF